MYNSNNKPDDKCLEFTNINSEYCKNHFKVKYSNHLHDSIPNHLLCDLDYATKEQIENEINLFPKPVIQNTINNCVLNCQKDSDLNLYSKNCCAICGLIFYKININEILFDEFLNFKGIHKVKPQNSLKIPNHFYLHP